MKYLCLIALVLICPLSHGEITPLTHSPKQDAGIDGLKDGLLSKKHQSALYQQIKELFEKSKDKSRSEIISVFGNPKNHIVRKGDDGIDRISIYFHKIDEEVDRLSHRYNEITYFSGMMIAFEKENFIHWEPIYATRLVHGSPDNSEGKSEPDGSGQRET